MMAAGHIFCGCVKNKSLISLAESSSVNKKISYKIMTSKEKLWSVTKNPHASVGLNPIKS